MDRKKDAFDKTLASHVRKTMAGHKKVKKHGTHTSTRVPLKPGGFILDELEAEEKAREDRAEIHAMLNVGLDTLFPDMEQQKRALDIEDTDEGTADTLRALTYKCNVCIMGMDIDDIDDLMYILDLLDGETGAWYWNKIKEQLKDGIALRLRDMGKEEEENDDE